MNFRLIYVRLSAAIGRKLQILREPVAHACILVTGFLLKTVSFSGKADWLAFCSTMEYRPASNKAGTNIVIAEGVPVAIIKPTKTTNESE
ncbi:hypothetical protein [Taibaiella koreensis]|uniref:hypothetical protein n=1 Tax=Taibaiella koreensis TaxID=1268548 RepID=UPI000E599900|nr:hypothetical protein [Taibaiella koreensis]